MSLPVKVTNPLLLSMLTALLVWTFWFIYTMPETLSILQQNWQISLTMVFGSFVAGATSEGGGAIAFPVFTKVLHIPAIDAKIFSLAIQSVGMTAASLTIIAMRIGIDWRVVLWVSLGGIPGCILGAAVLTPMLPPELVKLSFTAMVTSFAFTLIRINMKDRYYNARLPLCDGKVKLILFSSGFFGGIMSGLVGSGIDIICFSVLVLLFRFSEKIATPTSVILMAINATIGFALHAFLIGGVTAQVQNYWLAAIPVVVVGAPAGAFFCSQLHAKTIAAVLIVLIAIELVSSLMIIPLTLHLLTVSLLILLFFSAIYFFMSKTSSYCVT